MTPDHPLATLHAAEEEYREAMERLDADRSAVVARRDQAIRGELARGKTLRQVGDEFGISHQRVAQIAHSG